jgi:hypothetical protein
MIKWLIGCIKTFAQMITSPPNPYFLLGPAFGRDCENPADFLERGAMWDSFHTSLPSPFRRGDWG